MAQTQYGERTVDTNQDDTMNETTWRPGDQFTASIPNNAAMRTTETAVHFHLPCGCEIVVGAGEQTAEWNCGHSMGHYCRIGSVRS